MPTGDFENLISQLMMASGLQTKVQADQKHAAVQQMLSRPPVDLDIGAAHNIHSKPLGLDIGPAQNIHHPPLGLDIGPASNIRHPGDSASHMGPRGREPAGYKLSRKLYAQQHGEPDPYPDEPESMLRAQAQADVDQLMARKGGQQVGQDRSHAAGFALTPDDARTYGMTPDERRQYMYDKNTPLGADTRIRGEAGLFRNDPDAPVSEAQGYANLDRARMTPNPKDVQELRYGVPGHPVWSTLGGDKSGMDGEWLAARRLNKYGEPVVAPFDGYPVTAGDHANTHIADHGVVSPDYLSSADIRNLKDRYAAPIHEYEIDGPTTFDKDGNEVKGPRLNKALGVNKPADLLSDDDIKQDDDVSQTGWLPSDFDGMSHADAVAKIANQLRAHRIRTLMEADPEYLGTLPKY